MTAAIELPELAPYRAPRFDPGDQTWDRDWSGYLTRENVHHVAAWMRHLFAGRALSITNVCGPEFGSLYMPEPEVRAPVWFITDRGRTYDAAVDGVASFDAHGENQGAWIAFSDDGYAYGFHTYVDGPPRYFPSERASGVSRGRPRDVLDAIDSAIEYEHTPHLTLHSGTLTIRQRWFDGQVLYTAIRALEGRGQIDVVLRGEDAAVAREALDHAAAQQPTAGHQSPYLGVRDHIDRVFPGVEWWMPVR